MKLKEILENILWWPVLKLKEIYMYLVWDEKVRWEGDSAIIEYHSVEIRDKVLKYMQEKGLHCDPVRSKEIEYKYLKDLVKGKR